MGKPKRCKRDKENDNCRTFLVSEVFHVFGSLRADFEQKKLDNPEDFLGCPTGLLHLFLSNTLYREVLNIGKLMERYDHVILATVGSDCLSVVPP